MARPPSSRPSFACASTTTAATAAGAACSSAAGACTPSTSDRCRTTSSAGLPPLRDLLPGARASPSRRARWPSARTPPGPPALRKSIWRQAETGGVLLTGMGNDQPYFRSSSTTCCSTPARSPTRPSTRCASRWSCARTWAASRSRWRWRRTAGGGQPQDAASAATTRARDAHHLRADVLRLHLAQRAEEPGDGGGGAAASCGTPARAACTRTLPVSRPRDRAVRVRALRREHRST